MKYFLELGAKWLLHQGYRKLKYGGVGIETGGTCISLQCDITSLREVENMLQGV
jgi:hypothetical protein